MKRYALFPLITLALTACGGGGSEGGSTTAPEQAPTAVEGKIQSVDGSTITVNDRQYEVASLTYQGQQLEASMLEAGTMVSLTTNGRSALSSRAATGASVEFDPTFTGVINVDENRKGHFTVNGIALYFDQLSSGINDGDSVMVSTLPSANFSYKVLSVIEFENNWGEPAEAEGRISNIDFNNRTFNIGKSLTVLFDERLTNTPHKLQNGTWVQVLGSYNESNGELTAEDIKLKNFNGVMGRGEVEGIVTWVSEDQNRFELNYRGIFNIDKSTKFEYEDEPTELKPGIEVEVEFVNTDKETKAKEIEFEDIEFDDIWEQFEFKADGYVEELIDVDGAQSFTLENNKGIQTTIHIDSMTEFDQDDESGKLGFGTLQGECIEVEGVIIGDDSVAREIERSDDC